MESKSRFFDRPADVPIYAITMGVGTILDARKLILLANGANKANAVAQMIEGPVTSMITASALQLHSSAKVFLDEASASQLKMRDYYDWVMKKKPDAPQT